MFKNMDMLGLFFDEPAREFNVREVARKARKSPATVSSYLKRWTAHRVLKHRSERGFDLYSAHMESDAYRDIKVWYNIRKIRESGLMDALDQYYLKPTVVLFGSMASGQDAESSDVDLLVVSEKNETMALQTYEKKLRRPIQIFTVKKLSDLRNEHLINNILNGITLQGALKWT